MHLLGASKWEWCVCFHCSKSTFSCFSSCRQRYIGQGWGVVNMPSSHLQPVLKMKVDELFFVWLSDPTTQSLLKDYLDLIKSGQHLDLDKGDSPDKKSLTFNENNNVASQKNLAEERPFPTTALPNPSPTSALPSGSSCNTRMTGPNGRVLRKSISTRKVNHTLYWEHEYVIIYFVINLFTFSDS